MTIKLDIIAYSIFDIDSEHQTHDNIDLKDIKVDALKVFVSNLAKKTVSDSSTRLARFEKDSIASKHLSELAKQHKDTSQLNHVAKRLVDAEALQNTKSGHLNKIKPGSLVIAKFKGENGESLLISKIEFESYLAKKTFLAQQGLPQEKGLLKSCLLRITDGLLDDAVTLSDSNSAIASFWYKDFLQCTFTKDDSLNTKLAIRELRNCIKCVKKESLDDYLDLQERVNGYFISHTTFEFDIFETELLSNFEPQKKDLDLTPLMTELKRVKSQRNFDGKFTIDKTELKKRIKKSFDLDNEVTVVAKSGTSTIFKTKKGEQSYIVIKTNTTPAELKEIIF